MAVNNPEDHKASPVLIAGAIRDESIESEPGDSKTAALVSTGKIVILKNVFDRAAMTDFRRAVTGWCKSTPPYPHGVAPSTTPTRNYHRVDDGRIASSLPHVFHQVCFNNLEALDGEVGQQARSIVGMMRNFQNRVAGTKFDFSPTGLRVKVLRYPNGGGYLAEHMHPLEPQRIGLILSLSRVGHDFVRGGTTFQTPFGFVDTNEDHDIGDVIVFRYDLAHGVKAVDPEKEIDWKSESGKWTVLLELRETHGQSSAKM